MEKPHPQAIYTSRLTSPLLVKALDRYAIKLGEVHIEHHSLMAKKPYVRLYRDTWGPTTLGHLEQRCTFLFFHLRLQIATSIIASRDFNSASMRRKNLVHVPFWSDSVVLVGPVYVMLTSV